MVLAWWLAFLAANVVERVASAMAPTDATADSDVADALASSANAEWVAQILGIIAAMLAIVVVRRIAGAVRRSYEPMSDQVTAR